MEEESPEPLITPDFRCTCSSTAWLRGDPAEEAVADYEIGALSELFYERTSAAKS